MVPLWLWVLGRRPLEGLCHPYCIISRVHTINIIVDLDITWLRSCCQISPLSSYFPSTFLCYTLWKEVTSCSPLRGELCSISLKAVYLYTLFGIILHGIFGLSLLSHFFKSIQSFTYITKDLWIFILYYIYICVCVCVLDFPSGSGGKNPPAVQETQIWTLGQEDPQRRKWQPIPVFLPGKSHGQRSLVGYSSWGQKESFTT